MELEIQEHKKIIAEINWEEYFTEMHWHKHIPVEIKTNLYLDMNMIYSWSYNFK